MRYEAWSTNTRAVLVERDKNARVVRWLCVNPEHPPIGSVYGYPYLFGLRYDIDVAVFERLWQESEMHLSKKTTPGKCPVSRCKFASAPSTVNPHGLCDKHLDEWANAGCPVLTDSKPAPDPTTAAAAMVVVDAQTSQEVLGTRNAVLEMLQYVSNLVLDSQAALDWLGATRANAHSAFEWVEAKRKHLKAPHLEGGRRVDEFFAPARDSAKALLDACDEKLRAFRAAQIQAQDAALGMIQNGNRDDATIMAAHLAGPQLPAQVDTRVSYRVEVLNFAEVPDMFKQLDESAVLTYARERGGRVQIPGLVVHKVETIVKAREDAHA